MPPLRRRTLWLALLAFLVLAMPHTATGVAWPSLAADLALPVGELGLLIGVGVVGYFTATVTSGIAAVRIGTGRLMTAAAWLAVVGLAGQALAPSRPALLGAALLTGVATGFVDAGVNTHVALSHGTRAMGMLHAGYGVGATLGPALMTVLVGAAASGWRWGFGVLAMAQAVVAVLCVGGRPGWVSSPPVERAAGARRLTATSWWALAVFMLYVGFEVGAGQWAFTLFTEGRGMSDAVAGVAVTAFYAALTAARFLLGGFGHRVSVTGISTASVVLAFVAALILWWAPVPWLGVLALVVCGFALGPIFPLQMTLTPQRTGAGGTASMVGYQIGAASLGAFVVPGLIGLLVEPWGVSVIAPVLVLVGAALVATDLVLRRMPTTETEPVAI